MEQIRENYLQLVQNFHLEKNENILGEIQNLIDDKSQRKSFNLSSVFLPETQCNVLAKLFSHDYFISDYFFNDCNLSSEALQNLMHGFVTNTTCKTLELKGNRIHGAGTEAISRVLRKNQTLQKLRLEWNQIGAMDSTAFTNFCDSLSTNKGLVELDLRNNDISHVGGTELAAALKRNCTLRILDLRWNNIGTTGASALLSCCQSNSTLCELHLVGNDVSEDILQHIAHTLTKNCEKRQMHFGHSNQMAVIARQLQNAQNDKDRQVTSLLKRVSIQEQAMLKANKSLAEKIKKLEMTLEDRRIQFNALSAKNTLLETDLTLSTQQYQDVLNNIKRLKIDNQQLLDKLEHEHRKEKDDLLSLQEKLQRQLNESIEECRRLKNKLDDSQRKSENLSVTTEELRRNIVENDRDHHIEISSLNDENQRLKLKHREELKDAELSHQREIQRLTETFSSSELILKDQINKLETIRTTLEREINALKSTLATQKLNFDETLQQEKLRLKNEEDRNRNEFEQRIRTLNNSKDEIESRYNEVSQNNRETAQKLSFQLSENETLKRRIDSLQTIVDGKDAEIQGNREKLRTDYEKKISRIQKEIDLNDELKDQIKQLQEQNREQKFEDRNKIRELEMKIGELQTRLNQRESDLAQIKQNEEKRLNFLRTAMKDFVTRPDANSN